MSESSGRMVWRRALLGAWLFRLLAYPAPTAGAAKPHQLLSPPSAASVGLPQEMNAFREDLANTSARFSELEAELRNLKDAVEARGLKKDHLDAALTASTERLQQMTGEGDRVM